MLPGGGDESDYTLFERFPNPDDGQHRQRSLTDSAVSVLRVLIARSPAIHVELSLPKGISFESLWSVFDVARLLAIDSATIRPFLLQIRCDASDEKLVREFGRSYGFGEAAIALREPG